MHLSNMYEFCPAHIDDNELYLFDHKYYMQVVHIFHISIIVVAVDTSNKVNIYVTAP